MTPELPWAVPVLDHSSSEEIFPNIQPNFSYYPAHPWTGTMDSSHSTKHCIYIFWFSFLRRNQNVFCQQFKGCFREHSGSKGCVLSEKTRIWEDERSCAVRNWPLCSYDMEIAVLSCCSVHWPKQKSWKYSWNYLCLYNQATSMQNCFLMTHHSALFVFSRQPADWEELLDLRFLPGSLYKHLNFISCL